MLPKVTCGSSNGDNKQRINPCDNVSLCLINKSSMDISLKNSFSSLSASGKSGLSCFCRVAVR